MLAYLKGTAVIIPPCFIWTRSCLSSRRWMLRIVVLSGIQSLINQINQCLPWNDCFPLGNCQEFLTVCPLLKVFCTSSANPSAAFLPIFSTFMCLLGYNSGNQVDWSLVAQPCLGAFAKHYTFERVFCCLICLSAGLITD